MSLDMKAALAALEDPRQREIYLQQVRDSRRESPTSLGEGLMVDFGLAPAWTRSLLAAVLFPSPGEGPGGTQALEELLSKEWVRSRFVLFGAWTPQSQERGEDFFWMDEGRRQALLEDVIQDGKRGRSYLTSRLESVGRHILTARDHGVRVPDITASWALFAAQARWPQLLAGMVDEQLRAFLQQRKPADARQWLESLRRLEVLQEGQFSLATSRAERQVELLYRQVDDERRLSNYQLRLEQLRAFEQLLEAPNEQWGLHFMGPGGVGKTMLMRYLSAKLAPERKMSTARVDFDHLDPSYPSSQPGLLLKQLGAELRLHDTTGAAARLLSECDLLILSIHEQLKKEPIGSEQLRGTPNFRQLVRMFAEAMRLLPQPVVLLLDTCEELARLDVGLGGARNVEEAFALLKMLVESFYSEDNQGAKLRVVFSGRRPLASNGKGWELVRASPLQPRPFLRLHEVHGFTEKESRRFLLANHVPEELVAPILEKSQEFSRAPEVQWPLGSTRTSGEPRFLPYQLALYAHWLDTKEVDAQRIRETTFEQYLSLRIIDRLRSSEAERLLPAAALLGEFTRTTLRRTWTGDDASFDRGLAALSWQEWVESPEAERYVLQPRLRYQLERYYAASRPEEVQHIRQLALESLEPLTLEGRLDSPELRVGDFSVVLRLLSEQPQRLARWWTRVERRLGEESISWLEKLTSRWLGEQQSGRDDARAQGEEAPAQDSPILAALIASHCAARLHSEEGSEVYLFREWQEVERLAPQYPNEQEAQRLLLRARVGRIRSLPELEAPVVEGFWFLLDQALRKEVDEQLGASLVAGVETVLEHAENSGSSSEGELPIRSVEVERLARALASASAPLQAFAWALVGRAHRGWGRLGDVRRYFAKALRLCPIPLTPTRQRWLDWVAPENLGARVRVEAFRALHPGLLTPSAMLSLLGTDIMDFWTEDSLDTDRLASALLSLRYATQGPQAPNLLPDSVQFRSTLWNPATRNCHRDVRPLFTVTSEYFASSGQVSTAWKALSKVRTAGESKAHLETADSADATRVRIAIRIRLSEGLPFARMAVGNSLHMHLRALVEPPLRPAQPGIPTLSGGDVPWLRHGIWRALSATSEEIGREVLDWGRDALPGRVGYSPFEACSLSLDRIELYLLACQWERAPRPDSTPFPLAELEQVLSEQRPDEALKLALRISALCGRHEYPEAFRAVRAKSRFAAQLGIRRAAEIALEEGELLALRLPSQALMLLKQAMKWFRDASDDAGGLQATTVWHMAHARLGKRPRGGLDRLREAYELSQERLSFLPAWDLLEEDPQWPRFTRIRKLQDPLWLPWLVRIQACIAWSRGDEEALETLPHCYADVLGKEGVPAELHGWRQPARKSSSGGAGASSPWFALEPFAHPAPSPPSRLGVPLGVPRAPRPASPPWTAASMSIFAVSSRAAADNLDFEALELEIRWRAPITRPGPAESFFLHTSALIPYDRGAGVVPPPLVGRLEQLASNSPARPRIRLMLDESAMAFCWEGLLFRAMRYHLPSSRQPAFFRVGARDLHGKTRPWSVPGSLVSLVSSLPQEELAARGWSHFIERGGIHHQLSQTRGRVSELQDLLPRELEALHLIGTPVRAGRGVRFLFTQEDAHEKASFERGELLSAAELGSSLPRLSLCVLQDVPGVETLRTSSDRQRAALMRLFAAELQQTGVPLVVCIPALAPEHAKQALEDVADALTAPDVMGTLFFSLQTLRTDILSQASGADSPETECAYDFAVFYSDDPSSSPE